MESYFLSKGTFRFLMVVFIGTVFGGSLLSDTSLDGILGIQDDTDASITTAEIDSFEYTKPVLEYIAHQENIEIGQLQTVNERVICVKNRNHVFCISFLLEIYSPVGFPFHDVFITIRTDLKRFHHAP